MDNQVSISAALSGVFCVADAEKLRGQREMEKLIKVLSNIKVFKTSDEVLNFLADKGFVTSDVDGRARIITMRAYNLEVEIHEFNENSFDYAISCRSVQPDA